MEKETRENVERKENFEDIPKKFPGRFFSGSIGEYEDHVGHRVKVIDVGTQEMRVMVGESGSWWIGDKEILRDIDDWDFFRRELLKHNPEALVRFSYGGQDRIYGHVHYGLPIAKA